MGVDWNQLNDNCSYLCKVVEVIRAAMRVSDMHVLPEAAPQPVLGDGLDLLMLPQRHIRLEHHEHRQVLKEDGAQIHQQLQKFLRRDVLQILPLGIQIQLQSHEYREVRYWRECSFWL